MNKNLATWRLYWYKKLSQLMGYDIPNPEKGWIWTVRRVLAMTSTQLAKRLGVSQQEVSRLERAERSGSLTLKKLRSAAAAMDCDLKLLFVPRQPIAKRLKKRALAKVRQQLARTEHTMSLEDQRVNRSLLNVERLAEELLRQKPSTLWDEDL